MLDLLSNYLKQATSPEEKDSFQVVCDAFDKIGLDDYEDAIEEIIYSEDNVEAGQVMFDLSNLLRAQAHQVLKMHAITFDEHTSLKMLGDLINGIVDLPNHEELKHILGIANSDSNLRERFCELMAIVTPYPAEVLLQHVEEVSPSFMIRLLELPEEEQDEALFTPDRQEKIAKFQLYCAHLPEGMPAYIGGMLKKGIDVGMPFTVYAGAVGITFEQMLPEQIAEEMFGMALVSSDGCNNPLQTVKEHLEEYLANPETITSVTARLTKINVECQL